MTDDTWEFTTEPAPDPHALCCRQCAKNREELARLKDGLRRTLFLAEHLFLMVPQSTWRDSGGDDSQGHYEGDYRAEGVRDELTGLRSLLAEDGAADERAIENAWLEDGAAQPRVYPVGDWDHATTECVACPGCAFTFASFHVTQATGQYDCPVCHAQSRDGAT